MDEVFWENTGTEVKIDQRIRIRIENEPAAISALRHMMKNACNRHLSKSSRGPIKLSELVAEGKRSRLSTVLELTKGRHPVVGS